MKRDPVTPEPIETFRGRVDLSKVDSVFPPTTFHGVAYRGWPTLVVGPTGSAKTLVCRWLLYDAMSEEGRVVGHADQEMGQQATRAYYEAMGATEDELARIVYWDLPSPKHEEHDHWMQHVLDQGVTDLLWDKLPDFLRSAALAENVNDDVNQFMADFIEPVQGQVTSLVIDATGWDGRHSRGGSEKDFKVALAWIVSVIDEPRKDHVGRVRWTCTKDRFGAVGRGTQVEFAVGGDGDGGIVCAVAQTTVGATALDADEADQKRRDMEDAWRVAAVVTAAKHAPDEVHAIAKTTLESLMGRGRASAKREGIEAAMSDPDPQHDRIGSKPKPGGNGVLVWWVPRTRPNGPTDGTSSDQAGDESGTSPTRPSSGVIGTGQVDKSSDRDKSSDESPTGAQGDPLFEPIVACLRKE